MDLLDHDSENENRSIGAENSCTKRKGKQRDRNQVRDMSGGGEARAPKSDLRAGLGRKKQQVRGEIGLGRLPEQKEGVGATSSHCSLQRTLESMRETEKNVSTRGSTALSKRKRSDIVRIEAIVARQRTSSGGSHVTKWRRAKKM